MKTSKHDGDTRRHSGMSHYGTEKFAKKVHRNKAKAKAARKARRKQRKK